MLRVSVSTTDIIQQHFARFDETFFQFCDKELLKINTFFSGTIFFITLFKNYGQ